jgi:elongation factor 1 alpha-like protein
VKQAIKPLGPAPSKPTVNLVVVGHVDAGKSTLMGHLLYQIGQVNDKVMHKNKQESQKAGKGSFAFAWILDETEEERFVESCLHRHYFVCFI